MARRNSGGDYSYHRTALVRGREADGRFAVIQLDEVHSRVVGRRPDGSAVGRGELVPTADVFDVKPTYVVVTGQRGTVTLPGELRRDLGIEEGTPLEFIREGDGRLSVRRLSRTTPDDPVADLDDLLGRVTPKNVHGEISFGDAVGRESW